MAPNQILQSDLLDLVFENRNQDYGAYELRRSYNTRILSALGISVVVALLLSLSSFVSAAKGDSAPPPIVDVVICDLFLTEPLPVPPPPPPVDPTSPAPAATIVFTEPNIVRDIEVSSKDLPPNVHQIELVQIDVSYPSGSGTHPVIPPADGGKGIVTTKDVDDSSFAPAEIEADFPGGMSAWKKFLERNLSADIASRAGAAAGSYTVMVHFTVDIDGLVSDVRTATKHGYGLEEEAVRVVKRSGKWTPAIQNGRPVKAVRTQPITFLVNEE